MNNTTTQIQPDYFYIRRKIFGEIDPNHGVTVAYYLSLRDGIINLVAGSAVCNELDNFNKKIGRTIAASRLNSFLQGDEHPLAFERPVVSLSEVPETAVSYFEGTNFVLIQEKQFPIFEKLQSIVMKEIVVTRLSCYEGYDEDVKEEIVAMFDDIEDGDEDDNDDDDEYDPLIDYDGEYDDEDDEDK